MVDKEIWENYFDKLNMTIPQDSLGINPAAMSKSKNINIIHFYGNLDKKDNTTFLISIYTFSFSSAQIQEIDEVKIISNRAQNENGIKKGYVISKNEIQNAPIQSIEDLLEYAVNIDLRQRGIDGFNLM